MSFYEKLKFDASGLIPAIVQEQGTGRVLMMAWMNRASLEKTIATGKTHFWSRKRQTFWMKGESSGHVQGVKDIAFDCDGDTLLIRVEPAGPACHTGARTCFQNESDPPEQSFDDSTESLGSLLDGLYSLIATRKAERPEGSYTTKLFDEGLKRILAKVDEESQETIVAGREESDQRLIEETSDLLYHLLVLLVQRGVTLDQIRDELAKRRGKRRNAK